MLSIKSKLPNRYVWVFLLVFGLTSFLPRNNVSWSLNLAVLPCRYRCDACFASREKQRKIHVLWCLVPGRSSAHVSNLPLLLCEVLHFISVQNLSRTEQLVFQKILLFHRAVLNLAVSCVYIFRLIDSRGFKKSQLVLYMSCNHFFSFSSVSITIFLSSAYLTMNSLSCRSLMQNSVCLHGHRND